MRILICDDEQKFVDDLKFHIERYMQTHLINAEITTTVLPEEILKGDTVYDLAFLDIQMPGVDGITLGKELKNRNSKLILFYVTAYSDYLDEAMKPFRQLQYDYYRNGLDEMAQNVERGRTNVTTALENCLKKAHEDKPLSLLPQIWTDYKKDELANIYKGKGTQKEKQTVYDILLGLNASQNTTWEKIRQ